MDTLFSDITIITMNDAQPVLHHAYVAVTDGAIAYVGADAPDGKAKRTIDGRGKLLMPGFINAHAHTPMALLRGYADDYVLQTWLFDHVFPAESRLDARAIRIGAQLSLLETTRTGTVSTTDMYYHLPDIAQAVLDAGTKTNLTNALLCLETDRYDFEGDRSTIEVRTVARDFVSQSGGRVRADAGIHAEYTSTPAMWADVIGFARELGLHMQLHLSETKAEHDECVARHGKTPTRMFYEAGVFDIPTTAAHGVWLTDDDMVLLADKGVSVSHNPVSNLKLASGMARVTAMQKAGVNVALGTDGVCSNNSTDLFEELKWAALLQKTVTGDASTLPAYEALKLATVHGARAQGRGHEMGRIEAGYDADVIMLDLDQPHLSPVYDPLSTVVYAARGSDVVLTMVQGKVLYENGEWLTLDRERIMHELNEYAVPLVKG